MEKGEEEEEKKEAPVALCASCDQCRARKKKCDGRRPCENCARKYMKKHKLYSIEGIDIAEFECVYSPAKRRGPVPARASQSRKTADPVRYPSHNSMEAEWIGGIGGLQSMEELRLQQMMMQNMGMGGAPGLGALQQGVNYLDTQQAAIRQQLNLIHQLQVQQHFPEMAEVEQPPTRRSKLDHARPSATASNGVPRTIAAHTHLLELSDPDGSRLRAYYRLSVDEPLGFPPSPTDEEYCTRLNIPGMTPRMIPGTHLAALSAARFAEVALGALIHDEVKLAIELANAVVHCLRESVQEPVQPPYMFEVARSYFLLSVFRAFRGDMIRYFKYRRVCLTYVSKLDNEANASTLLSAVAFLDAWAYMIYNADEKRLPNINASISQVSRSSPSIGATAVESEYNIRTNRCHIIASDPKNQNWIQGAPRVYLNNEAPLPARCLDALACALRTCCDQANGRFAAISKMTNTNEEIPQETIVTPTTTAVLAHANELSSRNMVLSALSLLQQNEAMTPSSHKEVGIHLVITAMDAFLNNGDEESTGSFTDSQIQSLLSACNTVIANPFLLHHGGPTYHLVSNAAVMLCHLLNSMYITKGPDGVQQTGDMEAAMFEEVLDTLIAIRKILVTHRRKLPVKLRCHGIPRPPLGLPPDGKPLIDLGETLLCACRGCQGFVLMACSPRVAAERARKAAAWRRVEEARDTELEAADDKELEDLSKAFDLDDDALLGMLSQLI